jgi:hypothetical protein
MSDFIFTSDRRSPGEITGILETIYRVEAPEMTEYHGEWGSLGVSRSLYHGFQPLETDSHLFVVIGGPVLLFAGNGHLTGDDPAAGTRRVMERWLTGSMQWDDDLSGPFVALSIDKRAKTATCITDLMLLIPVYRFLENGRLVLGTHPDTVAAAGTSSGIETASTEAPSTRTASTGTPSTRTATTGALSTRIANTQAPSTSSLTTDTVSIADFLMNHAVTWPYTFYEQVRQLHPAAWHRFDTGPGTARQTGEEIYWLPEQANPYGTIGEAARALREGLLRDVACITEGMDEVAQFISGGTDSRVVAGLLPEKINRDGYIFLDRMNREGRIAKQAARCYGLAFTPKYRSKSHYLDILPEASDLIGSGQQHFHAHSLVFNRECALGRYPAVFGGYSADVFLKGHYTGARLEKGFSPYDPGGEAPKATSLGVDIRSFIPGEIREQVAARRKAHLERVRQLRGDSAHEWARFWPASIRMGLPNLAVNRRLFRSYELFLGNTAVKMTAGVPTEWKRQYGLYHLAVRPFLKKSRWLLHPGGHFPYFGQEVNRVQKLGSTLWRLRKKWRKPGKRAVHQGPWSSWKTVRETSGWESWIRVCLEEGDSAGRLLTKPAEEIASNREMYSKQVVNLFQVMYFFSRRP